MKFWAYQDINNAIRVKAVREIHFAKQAIEDAFDSDFVSDVMEIYEASSRAEAEEKARTKFSTGPRTHQDEIA